VPASACVALVRRAGRLLLERPGPASPLRGHWDLPALELEPGAEAAGAMRGHLAKSHGLELAVGRPVARVTHGIMNRRFTLSVLPCRHLRGQTAGNPDLRWIEPREISGAAVSGATLKVLRAAGRLPGAAAAESPSIC